jgi:hypothetical protein
MAVPTLVELENLFQSVSVDITGLLPKDVRIGWQSEGQPAFNLEQNVIGLMVTIEPDPWNIQRDIIYEYINDLAISEDVTYYRVLNVQFQIFGPNAFDLADQLRSGLLSNSALMAFQALNVAPLTDIPTPIRVPYLFNGRWWDRADVTAIFNNRVTRSTEVEPLSGASIQVINRNGVQAEIILNEET